MIKTFRNQEGYMLEIIDGLIVIDREEIDKCPYCRSEEVEIILWDFTPNKNTFDDLWRCMERECGEEFIIKTKRNKQ